MKMTCFKEAAQTLGRKMKLRSTSGLTSRLHSFASREDGNLTIFSVFMFVGIVAICGIGVDLMLNEMNRTKLQGTLDRAVLAAADLDQKRDPETVVTDYFTAAGLSQYLIDADDQGVFNASKVIASAKMDMDPLFLNLLGIDTLEAPAYGVAEERLQDLEISLVLDISGSMDWNITEEDDNGNISNVTETIDGVEVNVTKIMELRRAAKEFIDIVLDPDNGGDATINIVPYSHTVNLGTTLASYYNLDTNHNYSNCVRFEASDYNDLDISRTSELDRLSNADVFLGSNSWWDTSYWYTSPTAWPLCPLDNYAEVLVHQNNETLLDAHIDSLDARGATAIDVGMKWGVALLDDTSQSLVTAMRANSDVPIEAVGRPVNYSDAQTLKMVVLMTDGENTTQYDLPENRQTGDSLVWVDENGSLDDYSDDEFFVKVNDDWDGDDRYFWEDNRNSNWSSRYKDYIPNNARRLTMAELHHRFASQIVEDRFFDKPYSDNTIGWSTYSQYSTQRVVLADADEADSRLAALCDKVAEEKNIIVYTIAFEAPTRGVTAMQSCASSDSHFFDVRGVELTEAFEVIASTVNQLRLTQ